MVIEFEHLERKRDGTGDWKGAAGSMPEGRRENWSALLS